MRKLCSGCKTEKDLSEFYKDKTGKFGVQHACKICRKEYQENTNYQKHYYLNNKKNFSEYAKKYYKNNRDVILARTKEWQENNKTRRNIRMIEYYKNNIDAHIAKNLRNRIIKVIHSKNKSASTLELLGCDVEFLKQHLEQQFDKNMTWGNYGSYWDIDHIIPCRAFDLSITENQRKCFHYTNLQPLESSLNSSKADRMTDGTNARSRICPVD